MYTPTFLLKKALISFFTVMLILNCLVVNAQDSTKRRTDTAVLPHNNPQHPADSIKKSEPAKEQADSLKENNSSPGDKTDESDETVVKVLYGKASFYANKFNGRPTANGEIFSQKKYTCACNKLSLGTWIRVTNLDNGKTVKVKVNDRLHRRMKRIVDLTRAAAEKLDFIHSGLTKVKVEVLKKKESREISAK